MLTCPSCGEQNPDGFRFCGACATPLTDEAPARREERKIVTVLFADLVGFTARAERLDPEDVRAFLAPYHERLRAEFERFGGTVEKFIGDAVMALFGAPTAHDDDPERAVRGALAIRDWAQEEGEIQVRIGITTGEALVALGARPERGEGMASGDVVNTAARLQAAAPVNAILVNEPTFRATERAVEYREAQPVEAKGKVEPIRVWEVLQARARVGVERLSGAPLVGRTQELTLLRDALVRVRREREPQLVTLVGVPGIGKSRLVFELFEELERGPELIYWRSGRSLPYGEGGAFWALAEIVKAQAGILESDTIDTVEDKLGRAVGDLVSDSGEAAWMERHLRPLAGLEAEEARDDRRAEAFAAWRRFLEALAEARPLVLVFEDLHWADDGVLDFVDHLAEWASGVPILVLATARPQLLARRPGWGGGKVNSATIRLAPLSEEESAVLVQALLGSAALPDEVQAELLERAGGNPLYAEEFARMRAERPGELTLPESVQGIIAARLDALPRAEKELIQDAAVMGRVFWLGALGTERWTLEERLHALERKEFVRRERRSSVVGDAEYVFRHTLIREVAYEQIPRAQRAEKHRQAAEWIEALGRSEDQAEMLAHHYLAALEYAGAGNQDAAAILDPARRALGRAGDRASSLNAFPAAAGFYASALDLWPPGSPDRAALLLRYGKAVQISEGGGEEALLEARDALAAAGDAEKSAEAEALVARIFWLRGDRERATESYEHALELVRDAPASESKAYVIAAIAGFRMTSGDHEEALRAGQEVLELAESLELHELRAAALNTIGAAKSFFVDPAGLADLERAVSIAESVSSPEVVRSYLNLGLELQNRGDLAEGRRLHERAVEVAERFGFGMHLRFARGWVGAHLYESGRWDDALRAAESFIAEVESGSPHMMETWARYVRGSLRLARDDVGGALVDSAAAVSLGRQLGDPQGLYHPLAFHARFLAAAGRLDEAEAFASELLASAAEDRRNVSHEWRWLLHLAVVLEQLGRGHEALATAERFSDATPWLEVVRAVARADFAEAAEVLAVMRYPPEEAHARLRAAERLVAEGRRPEAGDQLERARAFYRSVGATRFVRGAEALLAAPGGDEKGAEAPSKRRG